MACAVIANTDVADLLLAEYTSMEDAYDKETFGHATYDCAADLVEGLGQFDKAEPYLWCVVSHCDECDGSEGSCQTSSVGLHTRDECVSAVYNYLGFVSRKKSSPDYERAEEYYRHALDLWPSNCGALSYLTELYVTTGNVTAVDAAYERLCDVCGEDHESTLLLTDQLGACATGGPTPSPNVVPTPTPSTGVPFVVLGNLLFEGVALEDAVANEAVWIAAIADAADVDDTYISVTVDATGRRRRLAPGFRVAYLVAVASERAADDLVATITGLSAADVDAAVAQAAEDAGQASTFATVATTGISTPVSRAEDNGVDSASGGARLRASPLLAAGLAGAALALAL